MKLEDKRIIEYVKRKHSDENFDLEKFLNPSESDLRDANKLKNIDKAVEISCAKEFVDGLSDGYEHEITSKGTNLSGGQRQRLLISRAIARNPKILVLDDSSSALDYKTDLLLRSAIKAGCRKDGVLVLVSQRVSTVKDCDLILVLDKGRIIGKGKHDDLLRNCEEYALIAKGQMGNVD